MMAVLPFAGMDSLPRDLRSRIDSERTALAGAQSSSAHRAGRSHPRAPVRARALSLHRRQPELARRARPVRRRPAVRRARYGAAHRARESRTAAAIATRWSTCSRTSGSSAPPPLSRADRRSEGRRPLDRSQEASARSRRSRWIAITRRSMPSILRRGRRRSKGGDRLAGEEGRSRRPARAFAVSAAQADTLWQSTATARREAAAGNYAGLDFGALFGAADTLHTTAADLPQKSDRAAALTGQLYTILGQAAGGHGGAQPLVPAEAPHRHARKTSARPSPTRNG